MRKVMMLTTTAYMSERFNRNNILILEKMGYEVHVVANFDKGNPTSQEVLEQFKNWILEHHGKWYDISVTKHPSDFVNNSKAYKSLLELIDENKYEFIHCHTPVAGVLGRLVAHKTNTKVIYTAHGFHFYKGAPVKNWLLFYPVERLLSRWTDLLITINQEDYQRAKSKFHMKKLKYMPGVGIDIKKFQGENLKDRKEKREELGIEEDDIVIISVGELSVRKNQIVGIEAIHGIGKNKLKYLICGIGKLENQYRNKINEYGLESQIKLLGYRTDISELCLASDIFLFPSKQEGLPVALMEAIAMKVPVICSNIRGNSDLIDNTQYLFNPFKIEEIKQCLFKVIESDNTKYVEENYVKLQKYKIENVDSLMQTLYKEIE